ncbi:lysophospholipid acyltransferase family protein [Jatrophihabitans sp. DSM 45814]
MAEAKIIRLHGPSNGEPEAAPLEPEAVPIQPEAVPIEPTIAPAEAATAPAEAATAPAEPATESHSDGSWERKAAAGLAFLRRRITGEYDVDEFGFDPELTQTVVLPAMRQLYRTWFRTEIIGIENLPADSGALIVANHAGALWALDAAMTATAVHEETPNHRFLRMLGADLLFTTPVLGTLARKAGTTLACNPDAERLLSGGELVGVWPEGFKGIGKPFSERYKLQRFGRGGFVSAALRTGSPIIPTSIVGSEEIHPMIGNAKTLARLLGLPYFPLTPTFPWLGPLGVVPLPSKWYIEFGEPIETAEYGPEAAEDPMLVFELTDRVREQIQGSLYRLLMQRRSIWR